MGRNGQRLSAAHAKNPHRPAMCGPVCVWGRANVPSAACAFRDALILLVIPESRSDIRDPVPLWINTRAERHWIDSRHPWRSPCEPPAAFAFAIPRSGRGQALQTQSAFAGMTKTGLIRPSLARGAPAIVRSMMFGMGGCQACTVSMADRCLSISRKRLVIAEVQAARELLRRMLAAALAPR